MRKIALIIIILMMAFTISACRGNSDTPDDPETGKISLKYWNSLTGADGSVMRQLVAQFNEEHKDEIEVFETFNNEVDFYTNINLLVPMKKGPDVMIMHSYLVQSYANDELLLPIDDFIESSNVDIKREDYLTDIFDSLYFEDQLFGVPLDVHTIGIYYNKDLLDKYDLDVPTNRAELLNAAHVVQDGERQTNSNFYSIPLSTVWPSEWVFTASLYQNGGLEIDEDGNPAYDSPEGNKALKAVADIIHEEKLSPLNVGVDQDLIMFQTGKALFHFQGSWMLNSMSDYDINFGVLPVSNMFVDAQSETSAQIPVRSHTFVVPQPSQTLTDARELAIMTFIKYMNDHSYIWATAGQIPASNLARANQEYLNLPYHAGFGDVEQFRVSAQSPYFHQAFSPVYSRVTTALSNPDYDASILLSQAVEEANQLLNEARS